MGKTLQTTMLSTHWGVMYWNSFTYTTTMALLRTRSEQRRLWQSLADEIDGTSVLDLCSGSGELQTWLNRPHYQGIDLNASFVREGQSLGRAITCGDIRATDWPSAECLVLCNSLYQFFDDTDHLFQRMLEHSCRKIIVSEPVVNWMTRLPSLVRPATDWFCRVDGKNHYQRYEETALRALLKRYGFQRIWRAGFNCTGILER